MHKQSASESMSSHQDILPNTRTSAHKIMWCLNLGYGSLDKVVKNGDSMANSMPL